MTTRRPRPRAPEGAFLLLALTGCAGAPARPGEAVVPGADPAQAEARALAAEARKAPAQAEGWLRAARELERLGADREAARRAEPVSQPDDRGHGHQNGPQGDPI